MHNSIFFNIKYLQINKKQIQVFLTPQTALLNIVQTKLKPLIDPLTIFIYKITISYNFYP